MNISPREQPFKDGRVTVIYTAAVVSVVVALAGVVYAIRETRAVLRAARRIPL